MGSEDVKIYEKLTQGAPTKVRQSGVWPQTRARKGYTPGDGHGRPDRRARNGQGPKPPPGGEKRGATARNQQGRGGRPNRAGKRRRARGRLTAPGAPTKEAKPRPLGATGLAAPARAPPPPLLVSGRLGPAPPPDGGSGHWTRARKGWTHGDGHGWVDRRAHRV